MFIQTKIPLDNQRPCEQHLTYQGNPEDSKETQNLVRKDISQILY